MYALRFNNSPEGQKERTVFSEPKWEGNVLKQEISKELEFELTVHEVAKKAELAYEIEAQKAELEAELKSTKKTFDGKIETLELERVATMKLVKQKREKRLVQCEMQKDYDRMVVGYYVGGKMIEERAMTPEERQLDLAEAKQKAEETEARDKKPETRQAELRQVIREETNAKTKADLVV